jgi:hypothetical protein
MDVNNNENTGIVLYANLLSDIKTRIRQAQVKATLSANAEMNQDIDSFLPQPVAKSGSSDFSHRPDAKSPSADLILSIPWGHHALLMEKLKDNSIRFWYMAQIIRNGWSRDTLGLMIKSEIHERQGSSTTNFRSTLPDPQSDLARQSLKDPYISDFLTLTEPFNERELETELGGIPQEESDDE